MTNPTIYCHFLSTVFTPEDYFPNNLDGNQHCIEVRIWADNVVANDYQCSEELGVLCERVGGTDGEFYYQTIVVLKIKLC